MRDTISHAFLFAGPRGTGKTSCAKILAKALNCTNLQDGEPCNECPNCLAADKGALADIIEIDAASNNGVDEIREIRDKVKYAPTQGKYKVYIIDEVHMLSMGAFNALLKTLEEPPAHVVFILATTELQKVPATIISRTQRYNFKRISKADLEKRMKFILEQEQISYEDDAIAVIAQVADGGMRDALSILDQLLSYEQKSVKYTDALQITGFAAKEKIEQLLLKILSANSGEALKQAKELQDEGATAKNILDELIDLTTKALIAKQTQQEQANEFITKDFLTQIGNYELEQLFKLVDLANAALNDLRYTNQQQIPLEVFLVQASIYRPISLNTGNSDLSDEIGQLRQQIESLQKQVQELKKRPAANANVASGKQATPSQHDIPKPATSINNNRKQVYHVLENATKNDLATIKDVWPDLQSVLEVSQRALLDVLEPVAASHDQVVMKCKYTLWFEKASADDDLLAKLTSYIEQFTKHTYDIVLVPDDDWLDVRNEYVKTHRQQLIAKKRQQIEEDETVNSNEADQKVVAKAKELFGDLAEIKD
ncbi:DNA-directed DNA polymerase [Lactobacillus gigeriorum DSM 23908 = CRBIP 24.85]|uniref:DNA-directed DNA polymerase n=1 Tax=Lactobacillus gigeriorum DSM 23908 = CRBIP 24.85 TaxID=1423751 RepID=A0ABR5PWI9_9LACO|nr:DNA-directed DNA polymerase [Lactobacillus gigeriorum DSM 23908 = CRBIP 24.85]